MKRKYIALQSSVYLGCSEWSGDVAEVIEADTIEEAIVLAAREISDLREYGYGHDGEPRLFLIEADLSERLVESLPEIWDRAIAERKAKQAADKEAERRVAAVKKAEKLRAEIAAFAPAEQLARMQQELADIEALLGVKEES